MARWKSEIVPLGLKMVVGMARKKSKEHHQGQITKDLVCQGHYELHALDDVLLRKGKPMP